MHLFSGVVSLSALPGCLLAAAGSLAAAGDVPAAIGAPRTPSEAKDVRAARELVKRVTPAVAANVFFRLDASLPGFRLSRRGEGILIEAGDAARLIAGYGYYLKFVADCHLSWNGDRMELKLPLPAPERPLAVGANPWKIRFAFNYCALSYSAAFWDWPRWERELDFLALQGFTHLLVTAGLEEVWADLLAQMNCRQSIRSFIAHPAYAAWWHMGNLEGMGGPVSRELMARQARLGRRIAGRARELGMTPVIQGFMGLMPSDYRAENALVFPQGDWCGMRRPSVLLPTSTPAFEQAAKKWYEAVERVYGFRPAWFAGDLFHEGGNRNGIDERQAVKVVQKAMQEASPGSTWVLQAWGGNPSAACLESLDAKHTLILNLVKDMHGGDAPGREYGGIPWLWCELANFGGNTGLYGGLPLMARLGPALAARRERGLAGLGLLSEGIETNPLYYDFFFTRLTTDKPLSLEKELPLYARRRYGSENPLLIAALGLLANGLYNPDRRQEGCSESIVCSRPGWLVDKASTWSTANRYYDPADTLAAARLMLEAARNEPALGHLPTYRHDLVDIVRQVLADAFYDQLQIVRAAYERRDAQAYERESGIFLDLMRDLDALLDTNAAFRLETTTRRAAAMGSNAKEKAAMESLAKQLITTWSGSSDSHGLDDYSNRQWSTLVERYYLPRWELFFASYRGVLAGGVSPGEAERSFAKACRDWEMSFPSRELPVRRQQGEAELAATARVLSTRGPLLDKLASRARPSGAVLRWTLDAGESEVERDVTDRIEKAGGYVVAVTVVAPQPAAWSGVRLYEGEKEVARCALDGEGNGALRVQSLRSDLTSYTLVLRLARPATTPLQGTLSIEPRL